MLKFPHHAARSPPTPITELMLQRVLADGGGLGGDKKFGKLLIESRIRKQMGRNWPKFSKSYPDVPAQTGSKHWMRWRILAWDNECTEQTRPL